MNYASFGVRKHRSTVLAFFILLALLVLRKQIARMTTWKTEVLVKETMPVITSRNSRTNCALTTSGRSQNIVFLKTHKTGSSTFQNILFRLGEKKGLTFAFPFYTYQFAYPEKFAKGFVEDLPSRAREFNILCSHMRLDVEEVRKVMPSSSIYITILRDPMRTFESVFTYYRTSVPAFELVSNLSSDPLAAFLRAPNVYYDPRYAMNGLAKNPMTFDLGLNNTREQVDDAWQKELEKMDQDFHLIMIAEHFDESLILVKELLHLELEDLVYVTLNARHQDARMKVNLDKSHHIRTWNQLDMHLYDHFNKTLWKKVQCFGHSRMMQELQALHSLLKETRMRCLDGGPVGPEETLDSLRPWQPDTIKILGYNLRNNLTFSEYNHCFRLVLPELRYHAYLYEQQYGRAMKTLPLD